ncbi:MAG: hypothetical protein ACLFQY_14915 [Desulfococcaceae bacterium]
MPALSRGNHRGIAPTKSGTEIYAQVLGKREEISVEKRIAYFWISRYFKNEERIRRIINLQMHTRFPMIPREDFQRELKEEVLKSLTEKDIDRILEGLSDEFHLEKVLV